MIIPGSSSKYDGNTDKKGKPRTIIWDANHMYFNKDKSIMRSPSVTLAHEVNHAVQHETDPEQFLIDAQPNQSDYTTKSDEITIKGAEQVTARALGEITNEQFTRTSHFSIRGPFVSGLSAESQSQKAFLYNNPLKKITNEPYDVVHYNE